MFAYVHEIHNNKRYHNAIKQCIGECVRTFGKCHIFDLHGQSHRPNVVELGYADIDESPTSFFVKSKTLMGCTDLLTKRGGEGREGGRRTPSLFSQGR